MLSEYVAVYDYFKSTYIDIADVKNKFSVAHHQLIDYWALNGDKTNDIPGVAGIGKQGAINLLTHYVNVESALQCSSPPNELKRVMNKLNNNREEYIRAKLLVNLRQDIHLGFSLKALRLPN